MGSQVAIAGLLEALLEPRLSSSANVWLRDQCAQVAAGTQSAPRFHMAFSAVTRHVPTRQVPAQTLGLSEGERARVAAAVPGMDLSAWGLDELARARLLVAWADAMRDADPTALVAWLDDLCADADLGELMAVYRSLSLLPHPEALRSRAAEGIRSNMTALVAAVACDSPYVAAWLEEGAFAQLVLKCLFTGVPLHRVVGLDDRLTEDLATRLLDYVRERRAAARPIPRELWRCVGPVVRGDELEVVAQGLHEGAEADRLAVALSLTGNPAAATRLAGEPELMAKLDAVPVDAQGSRWPALVAAP